VRTAWEIARRCQPADAVAVIDALAARRGISRPDLLAYAHEHRREYGARKAELALQLVEPLAESPQESRLRVYLVLGGLPRPTVQFRVIHDGRFVARVDLAWPQQRLAVEYDGEWHSGRGQLAKDRQRIRALSAAGWYVYPVTKYDMRSPDVLVKDIGQVLASRGWTDQERG
jgi:very-short-patch-repair endonuclease